MKSKATITLVQFRTNEESTEIKLEAVFNEKQLEKYRELRSRDPFSKPPPPPPSNVRGK